MKRSSNLDLIRCVAIISVIGIHFFSYIGYYQVPMKGPAMLLGLSVRTFLGICVPLFLMLSGYLLRNKKPETNYYTKVIRILFTYIVAALMCLAYQNIILQNIGIRESVVRIFDFTAAPYGWYVEMYLGLFLIIPFINILLDNLSNRKKELLIASLLLLTSVPNLINGVFEGFADTGHVFPNWWASLYPITYYLLGARMREKNGTSTLSTSSLVLLMLIANFLFTLLNFFINHNREFTWNPIMDWGSPENVINAVLVFSILLRLKLTGLPSPLVKTMTVVSSCSLGMYLVSWIFDMSLYGWIVQEFSNIALRLCFFPIMVFAVALCSFVLSWAIEKSYNMFVKFVALSKHG